MPSAQSPELKTALAGQIARALAVFCVDEVIVFSDTPQTPSSQRHDHQAPHSSDFTGTSSPSHFLTHLLSYLETPPHLRKHLFPLHANLRSAGTLPSLDMPHHLRRDDWCEYREGVTMPCSSAPPTPVQAGLQHETLIPVALPPNTRVTLKLPLQPPPIHESITATAVAPTAPRTEGGYYWGYAVREATCLSAVFTEAPYDGGYDLSVGTSERGLSLATTLVEMVTAEGRLKVPYRHLVLVFGGVAGLEVAVRADPELSGLGSAGELFDHYVNLCPEQGSRTIRTEEAIWMGLMGLRPVVDARAREVD